MAKRSESSQSKAKGVDVALAHGPTEDGEGTRVIRLKDGAVSVGELRPAREGTPLAGSELVRLHPRNDAPALCDVEVLHDGTAPAQPQRNQRSAGPARIASAAYRRGWGQVFDRGRGRAAADPDRSLN